MYSRPIVSVVLITYNQEKYVKRAIESILMQKVSFPIEILVSDDASEDKTPEILRTILEQYPNRFKLYLRRENVGATANAYAMLSRVGGKYIASLEGDDYWTDELFLETAVTFLTAHPKFIGWEGKCRIVDLDGVELTTESGTKGKDFWKFDKQIYTFDDYCRWLLPGHISGLVYRNIYLTGKEECSILRRMHKQVGDRTILMLLSQEGNIFCSERSVMAYRFVTDSNASNWMANTNKANSRFEEYKLICRIESYLYKSYGRYHGLAALKRSKIAAAAIIYRNTPTKENYKILKKIISYRQNRLVAGLIALFAIIQKRFWILIGKPEHRVIV